MKTLFLFALVAVGCLPAFARSQTPDCKARLAIAMALSLPQATVADPFADANKADACPIKGADCNCGCTSGSFCTCATLDTREKAQAAANKTGKNYQTYDGGRTWEPERAAPVVYYQSAPQMPAFYGRSSGGCSSGSCR